ncbi:MAG TPA: SPFH domain-containing protein [Candidatus Babeliales bacterium]|nr:SPFH domain-containing protein [Candidatus Babeliales bacterium]
MLFSIYGTAIFFGIAFLFLVILLSKSVYLVQQAEVIIIERLGKFDRIIGPGLHIVVPFIEQPRTVVWSFIQQEDNGKRYYTMTKIIERIDLRESVYDFPKQNVITKDNVTMEINALLYYQITDPKAAVYEINNMPEAIEKYTQTRLRDIIGSMDLDETLVSRNTINARLTEILDEATDKWGVKVNRVELQEVNPPADIRVAMEKQMRAERERREMILRSEGKKQSAILEAEGVREAQILEADGQAQSRLKIADAEAKTITMIQQAAQADPLPYLIAMQYVKALPEMVKGKDDKLVVIPYEASSMIGSLATIKKLFENIS